MNAIFARPLSCRDRAGRAALAFAATAVYAASFHLALPGIARYADAIGVAAGAAWICFGVLLAARSAERATLLAWADACLIAMTPGCIVLLRAAAANLLVRVLMAPAAVVVYMSGG